ncbi:NicO-domain-containing protein [Exidia glandulosa HHB12029]|uniref:Nickel/cobalt efflux system n=1 Tax=Exidia glandulosa HHB12029 TaxID=1314781 RepID=A0A165CDI5_EXIGL|nr:NicO-domain-containing protein [Exidia glandulosa HHB12029]
MRLTLQGRALVLILGELAFTALVWTLAAVFLRDAIPLAMLAWTIGLRHGLDADHISAIDNATRGLLALDPPQLSVLCGLWFSLGHSTIVIVVNVAIAVSVDIYEKLDKVGSVGGIVGAAVSASFLFLIGLANSIILFGIIRRRRRRNASDDEGNTNMLMMRILGPVTRFVDRPWKMYPVGVLFGFGFDTASSIALLAITAVAQRQVVQGAVAILPFLFTAGMSLVDSLDSVLMVHSYAGFPEHKFKLLESSPPRISKESSKEALPPAHDLPAVNTSQTSGQDVVAAHPPPDDAAEGDVEVGKPVHEEDQTQEAAILRVKRNAMSNLSIVLTVMSILVAFSISLITTMGLIGEHCAACRDAAENDPGLAGKWWRGWAKANDKSGFIGAAIIATFLLVVVIWYGVRYIRRRRA